jgi:peptidoglycan/LPS O-acetylase OafA/YrhL
MKQSPSIRRLPKLFLALLGCLLTSPITLQAHPGHGWLDHGLGHTLASPSHLVVLALTGATLLGGAHLIRQRISRRALQGLGAMMLLVAAVLYGIPG